MLKKIFKLLIAFLLLIIVLIEGIDFAFSIKNYHLAKNNQNKVWVHRGLYDNKSIFENTIAAFDSAKKMGIKGIELDIFFIDSMDNFIVTHDMPNRYHLPTLYLSDIFLKYDTCFEYWLDLKNLTNENKKRIANKLMDATHDNTALINNIYIESGNAEPLSYLAEQKLKTIYWIQYNRTNWLKKTLKLTTIKCNFLRYDFVGGTIGASMADKDFFDEFENLPKYIFHIYTPEIFSRIENHPNIAVYLKDYIAEENK